MDPTYLFGKVRAIASLQNSWSSKLLTKFSVPGMDPSCEAGLKHNQKVVGCSCNGHATIAYLACQVSNITYRIHSCVIWFMTILFQSRLNGTFTNYES